MSLNAEQLQKIEDIKRRVRISEDAGLYATIEGVDTVDDIWYLLDMVRRLTENKGEQHGN